ncbi:hypothetical protein H072_2370 [Dactylellina haptotyla CBS 200.50]|uniref:Uncharacterized protein n=1 Tax=Dactylellina haptotyla (strain CBS 200.50) TaxID=1284197 RepID=S8C776_DACHA|nr:hypothetical protein H072_2370 [Dactylellina haptotyla CBS 200.50]
MGCAFSAPEISSGLTYYVDPAGAGAGDAFGFPAVFTNDLFTCGGAVVTPVLTQSTDGTSSVFTCNPFYAGSDTSVLCPGVTRSNMGGEYVFSVTITLGGGAITTLYNGFWTVVTTPGTTAITSGTTFTYNAFATEAGSPTTVTQTTTVDSNPSVQTVTYTSYGLTRHIDVPVTSTETSTITKTTTTTGCPALPPRRFVRAIQPAKREPVELAKRVVGYQAFDGVVDSDTATIYSTIVYEPNYNSLGTQTIPGATDTTTATVDGTGATATTTITTRVHDATTEYTTISKTKTTKSTTTVTNFPTTCVVAP